MIFSKVNGNNQRANENISLFWKFVELLSDFSSVFLRTGRLPWLKHPGFMVAFFDLDFGAL